MMNGGMGAMMAGMGLVWLLVIVVLVLRGRPKVVVPSTAESLTDAKIAEDQALIE